MISQLDHAYLQQLINYQKILQQRNSLLKQAGESGHLDETLLSILNDQLSDSGSFLYETRKTFLASLLPLAFTIYERIAGKSDELSWHTLVPYHQLLSKICYKTIEPKTSLYNEQIQVFIAMTLYYPWVINYSNQKLRKDKEKVYSLPSNWPSGRY